MSILMLGFFCHWAIDFVALIVCVREGMCKEGLTFSCLTLIVSYFMYVSLFACVLTPIFHSKKVYHQKI